MAESPAFKISGTKFDALWPLSRFNLRYGGWAGGSTRELTLGESVLR